MNPIEVYQLHLALKLHFTSKYDFHKYAGKVNVTAQQYEANKAKYHYGRIAKKYGDAAMNFLLANVLANPTGWAGTFTDEVYEAWRKRKESLTYNFTREVSDLFQEAVACGLSFDAMLDPMGGHPFIVQKHLGLDVSLETLVLFDSCVPFMADAIKKTTDPILKSLHFKMTKYKPFLAFDSAKVRKILKEKALDAFGNP